MTPGFFEIGAQSNFSFLRGASHPEEMVLAAEALGIAGLGLADRNTVAGVVRMHAAAKARPDRRTKPYPYQPGARLVFSDGTPDLLVYPMNRRGWGNLCRLLSAGNLRSEKGACTLYDADLQQWNGDLLAVVLPPDAIDEVRSADFAERLTGLRLCFGERLHMALAPLYNGLDRQRFREISRLAQKQGLSLIATNLPAYHLPDRKPLSDVMTAIREHVTVADAGFRLPPNAERHLKTAEELQPMLSDYPEAIARTAAFFNRLNFSLDELSRHQYPDESVEGEPPSLTLRRLAYEGAAERFAGPEGIPEKVRNLIEYELDLISRKAYEPYFLTVYKIMQHARAEGILCQGRGSAANSAVCFCLRITDVNPETTTLLFDRFLSTEREEPPDIDVDFEHERREEVIQFIYRTYGREHAALTAAVICYRARSAGREVAKAFGLSEDVQSAMAGSIWGWSQAALGEDQIKSAGLDASDKTTQRVMEYGSLLQRFPRHLSQHVGGFVMTRDRLDEIVPIMNTADGRYMIEWDKDDLDTLKILKVDVLALGMLSCLARALKLLEVHYDRRMTLASVINDQRDEVYDMICRADTLGVFQIESRAQMSMLPRLQPRAFYDLVIEVAIVRPGPIQGDMVHPYLKRRQEKREFGREPAYPNPELIPVLSRTLGVPLFQEQAMQIAITAAGFTPAEADRLRRAMATFRRTGQVADFKDRFVNGMLSKGYERDFAERCFSQIEGFGEYGFPESHAASFALLVYVSCWFKAFYPDVFCAAILNSQPMGFYAPAQLVRDAREHGVEVRPVDVNSSCWNSTLEVLGSTEGTGIRREAVERRHARMIGIMKSRHAVRLGFSLVKGLSEADIDRLVSRRETGPYVSVRDLWERSGLDRATIEKLADADAFRSMGLDRRAALWQVKALETSRASEAMPLFSSLMTGGEWQREASVTLPLMPVQEHVLNDYRTLSLSLKAHPVSFMRADMTALGITPSNRLPDVPDGRRIKIAGLVLVRQQPGSAKGVIFMTLEDETGVANAIVWPKIFQKYRPVVMGARLVAVHGRLQKQDGVIHVVATHLEDMSARLAVLKREQRRFAGTDRADEALRSPVDQRQKKHARNEAVREAVQVMPKGRNFH
ncbi:error-prone DNA polymerase [Ciceribacter sp. L1K23]|uniref:error-prone DNA polymerase n=1 Tax=Ciceribacter sp. L1K23 TaxID=2820276 RepID=UPI001B8323AA|nr:error-prone DNA polymerase [Ciceribacter sp. L1K23]MBR0557749.1 error-prone DNA polymerase [Ciceribacter sp. L1K23]